MIEIDFDVNKARLTSFKAAESFAEMIAANYIRPRAIKGYYNVTYHFTDNYNEDLIDELIKILVENGYKVRFEGGSPVLPEDYDKTLDISWD